MQRYRITSIGLDDIRIKALSLLYELITVLTHVTPLFAVAGKVEFLLSELKRSRGFQVCIEDDWKNFLSGLSDENQESGEQTLVEVFKAIPNRLGLRFEDTPQGDYLHVKEPKFCNS